MAKRKTPKKKISSYLKPKAPAVKRTIRAPDELWKRAEKLVGPKKGATSVNHVANLALEKFCDEAGV